MRSTSDSFRIEANFTLSSGVQPPSVQSVDEMRTKEGSLPARLFLQQKTTSLSNLILFSNVPPYSSLL